MGNPMKWITFFAIILLLSGMPSGRTATIVYGPHDTNMSLTSVAGPLTTTNVGAEQMMGLGASIVPHFSGAISINIQADCTNSIAQDGVSQTIRYGTGSAPIATDPATGTIAGATAGRAPSAANVYGDCSMHALATGLTVGTNYWLDLSWAAVNGGTASIIRIVVNAVEE